MVERKTKSRIGECATFHMEKEKILSEQRSLHEFFKRKLNELFKEMSQLRQDHLMQRLNWTRENGKEE